MGRKVHVYDGKTWFVKSDLGEDVKANVTWDVVIWHEAEDLMGVNIRVSGDVSVWEYVKHTVEAAGSVLSDVKRDFFILLGMYLGLESETEVKESRLYSDILTRVENEIKGLGED